MLAVGNVAEMFEWGARAVKLYQSTAAKPAAFREAAIYAAAEAMGLPVPKVWSGRAPPNTLALSGGLVAP